MLEEDKVIAGAGVTGAGVGSVPPPPPPPPQDEIAKDVINVARYRFNFFIVSDINLLYV